MRRFINFLLICNFLIVQNMTAEVNPQTTNKITDLGVLKEIKETLKYNKETKSYGTFAKTANENIFQYNGSLENNGVIKVELKGKGEKGENEEDSEEQELVIEAQGNSALIMGYSPFSNKRDVNKKIENANNTGMLSAKIEIEGRDAETHGTAKAIGAGNALLAYALSDFGEVKGSDGADNGVAVDGTAGASGGARVAIRRPKLTKSETVDNNSTTLSSLEKIDITSKPDNADFRGKNNKIKIEKLTNLGNMEGSIKITTPNGIPKEKGSMYAEEETLTLQQWRDISVASSGNGVSAYAYITSPTRLNFSENKENIASIGDIDNNLTISGNADFRTGDLATINNIDSSFSGNGISSASYTNNNAKHKTIAEIANISNNGEINGELKAVVGKNTGTGWHEYSNAKIKGSGNGVSSYTRDSNGQVKENRASIGNVDNTGIISGNIYVKAGSGYGENMAQIIASGNGITTYSITNARKKESSIGKINNSGIINGKAIVYGGKAKKSVDENVADKKLVLPIYEKSLPEDMREITENELDKWLAKNDIFLKKAAEERKKAKEKYEQEKIEINNKKEELKAKQEKLLSPDNEENKEKEVKILAEIKEEYEKKAKKIEEDIKKAEDSRRWLFPNSSGWIEKNNEIEALNKEKKEIEKNKDLVSNSNELNEEILEIYENKYKELESEVKELKKKIEENKKKIDNAGMWTPIYSLKKEIENAEKDIEKKEALIKAKVEISKTIVNKEEIEKDIEVLEKEIVELEKQAKEDYSASMGNHKVATIQTTTDMKASGNGISIQELGAGGKGIKFGGLKNEGIISGYSEVYHGHSQDDYTRVNHRLSGSGLAIRGNTKEKITNAGVISGNEFALLAKGKIDTSYSSLNPDFISGFEGGVDNYGILAGRVIIGGYEINASENENIRYFETIYTKKNPHNNYGMYIVLDKNGNKKKIIAGNAGEYDNKIIKNIISDNENDILNDLSNQVINGFGENGLIRIKENENKIAENSIFNSLKTTIKLEDEASLTLDRSIVNTNTFGNDTYVVLGSDGENTLTIKNESKLNGKVDLKKGNDRLIIVGNNNFNGNIDLGEGENILTFEKEKTMLRSIGNTDTIFNGTVENAKLVEIKDNLIFTPRTKISGIENLIIGNNGNLEYRFADKENQAFADLVGKSFKITKTEGAGEFNLIPLGEKLEIGRMSDILGFDIKEEIIETKVESEVPKEEAPKENITENKEDVEEANALTTEVSKEETAKENITENKEDVEESNALTTEVSKEETPKKNIAENKEDVEENKELTTEAQKEETPKKNIAENKEDVEENKELTTEAPKKEAPKENITENEKNNKFFVDPRAIPTEKYSKNAFNAYIEVFKATNQNLLKNYLESETKFKKYLYDLTNNNPNMLLKDGAISILTNYYQDSSNSKFVRRNEIAVQGNISNHKKKYPTSEYYTRYNGMDTKLIYGLSDNFNISGHLGVGEIRLQSEKETKANNIITGLELKYDKNNFTWSNLISYQNIKSRTKDKLDIYSLYSAIRYSFLLENDLKISPKVNFMFANIREKENTNENLVLNKQNQNYAQTGMEIELSKGKKIKNSEILFKFSAGYTMQKALKDRKAHWKNGKNEFLIKAPKTDDYISMDMGIEYKNINGFSTKASYKKSKQFKVFSLGLGYEF